MSSPFDNLLTRFNDILLGDNFDNVKQTALIGAYRTESALVQEAMICAVMLRAWNDTKLPSYLLLHSFYEEASSQRARLKTIIVILILMSRNKVNVHEIESSFFPGLNSILLNYSTDIQQSLFAINATDRVVRYKEKLLKDVQGIDSDSADSLMKNMLGAMDSLIHEGYDVNADMFRYSISHPFFQEMYNWFIPFSKEHPMLQNQNKKIPPMLQILLSTLIHNDANCELDKYSTNLFFNTISSSHQIHVNAVNMPDGAASEEMTKILGEIIRIKDEKLEDKHIINNIIHELCRFFTMSKWAGEYDNPFENVVLLYDILYNLPEDFYYRCSPAAMKVGMFNKFTLHLNPVIRLDIIEKMLSETPEDANVLVEKGTILMEENRWKEALSIFSMLEYKGQKVKTSTKAIAICCQELGDVEKSERYYRKLEALG